MARSAEKPDPSCESELHGILAFSSFEDAERTLFHLEKLRQKYLDSGDKIGVGRCRQVALRGRQRAEFIGRNPKVRPEKRAQKLEIAEWFRVWLETPELFTDWLALRKETAEFKELLDQELLDAER